MAFLDSQSLKINHPADVSVCVSACVRGYVCVLLGHFWKVVLFSIVFDKVRNYKGHKELPQFNFCVIAQ